MSAPPIVHRAPGLLESAAGAPGRTRFLSGWSWVALLFLFGLFFVLTPYDLLSSVSGYSLAERHGEIDVALDTVEGGSVARRVTVLLLLAGGLVAAVGSRRESRGYNLAVVTSASAFLILALASPLWGDEFAFTLRRVIVLLVLAVSAFGFARAWDPQTIPRVTFVLAGASIVVGLAAEVVLGTMHPLDPEYRFRGLSHPNSMGQLCALFALSSIVLARQFEGGRSAIMQGLAVVGLGLLVMTKARGSIVGVAAALLFVAVSTIGRRTLLLAGSTLGSLLLGVTMFLPGFSDKAGEAISSLGRSQGGAADLLTLTGRTSLWQDLFQYTAQRPVLGYGYDSFWTPSRILDIARSQGWIIGSSHSGYIDVLIGLGGVGLAVFLLLLASCLWSSIAQWRRTRSAGSLFAVMILLWLLTNIFTEVIWFETSIPSFIGMLVVARLTLKEAPETAAARWGVEVRHAG